MNVPVFLPLALALTVVGCASPRVSSPVPAVRTPTQTSPESRPPPTVTPAASSSAGTPTPAQRPDRYVAIGASDTVGVGATDPRNGSWPARVAVRLAPGSTYTNLGVSGSLAAQARTQQLQPAVDADPSVVTLWLAVNDLNAGVSASAYRDVIDGFLGELVGRTQALIFVGNVPDLRAIPAYRGIDATQLGAQVGAYNRAVAETAAKYPTRVVVVDLFAGSAELMSTGTVAADGFHPSDGGYQLIADRFVAAMRSPGIVR